MLISRFQKPTGRRQGQKHGPVAGFKKIGKHPGDEGEKKRERPQRRLTRNARSDQGKEQQGQEQRDSVAEIARSARR